MKINGKKNNKEDIYKLWNAQRISIQNMWRTSKNKNRNRNSKEKCEKVNNGKLSEEVAWMVSKYVKKKKSETSLVIKRVKLKQMTFYSTSSQKNIKAWYKQMASICICSVGWNLKNPLNIK